MYWYGNWYMKVGLVVILNLKVPIDNMYLSAITYLSIVCHLYVIGRPGKLLGVSRSA